MLKRAIAIVACVCLAGCQQSTLEEDGTTASAVAGDIKGPPSAQPQPSPTSADTQAGDCGQRSRAAATAQCIYDVMKLHYPDAKDLGVARGDLEHSRSDMASCATRIDAVGKLADAASQKVNRDMIQDHERQGATIGSIAAITRASCTRAIDEAEQEMPGLAAFVDQP